MPSLGTVLELTKPEQNSRAEIMKAPGTIAVFVYTILERGKVTTPLTDTKLGLGAERDLSHKGVPGQVRFA